MAYSSGHVGRDEGSWEVVGLASHDWGWRRGSLRADSWKELQIEIWQILIRKSGAG